MSFPVDQVWDAKAIEKLAPDAASVPAAKKVLAKGGFKKIEPTADGRGWWCVCKGMTDTYQVSARLDEKGKLSAACTCPSPKDPCKHALAFLLYLGAHPEFRSAAKPVKGTGGDMEGLLKAVFASPDDDTPRLILADYLDETGAAERATLIRAQCALTTLPAKSRNRAAAEAEARAAETAVKRLIGPVPEQFTLKFDRGFAVVTTGWEGLGDVAGWPARFAELFRNGWVYRLSMRSSEEHVWGEIRAVLRQVGVLDFSKVRLSEKDLSRLAADLRDKGNRIAAVEVHPRDREYFQALGRGEKDDDPPKGPEGEDNTGEMRHYIGLTERQVETLARHDRLREIQLLTLENCPGDTVAHLVGYARLPRLAGLYVRGGGVGPAGMTAIANGEFGRLDDLTVDRQDGTGLTTALAAVSPRLVRFAMTDCGLTDADAATLADGPEWPRLNTLDLSANRLTAAGARALVESRRWPTLRALITRGNPAPLGELFAGVVALPADQAFTLDHGDLTVHRQPGRGREALKLTVQGRGTAAGLFDGLPGCRGADRMTHLTTAGVALAAADIADLFEGVAGGRLWFLALRSAKLGDAGAAAVADGMERAEMQYLDLTHNRIGVPGLTALANSSGLRSVVTLFLTGSQVPVTGLEALADSPHRDRLEEVHCAGGRLSAAKKKELGARFGRGVRLSV